MKERLPSKSEVFDETPEPDNKAIKLIGSITLSALLLAQSAVSNIASIADDARDSE